MRRLLSVGAAGLMFAALAFPAAAAVGAGATTVVVTSTDLVTGTPSPGQFAVINQSGGGGGVGMVFGPGTPPLGQGSLQLTMTGAADHWSVYNYDHIGTALSAITALSYATYTNNATTAPALQLEINPEPSGSLNYATLNFEPYINPNQQPLAPYTWQTWNVLAGKIWLTHTDSAVHGGEGIQATPITWVELLSDYPNAVIKGGAGVNVGSGWSAMTGAADAFTIGTATTTITYNFEPSTGNRSFQSAGSGTESSLSAPGCQNVAPFDCTVRSAGTATTSHLGTGPYTSTLTVHWGSYFSNDEGGFCAPADGAGTFTAANGDTLTQSETGIVCEVGATSLTAPHSFAGSFTDTGGTGRFANATGGGTITGGDDGSGNSNYSETGNISY